jgi:hypothetical protein
MNLPQIFSRFHLRKLERRPLSLRAGSFVLRGLEIHASTLKSQTDLVDLFLYAWHIFNDDHRLQPLACRDAAIRAGGREVGLSDECEGLTRLPDQQS